MIIADVDDFRRAARRKLPNFLYEYIDGGSYAETTLRRNTADFQSIGVRQRVMRDVSDIVLSTHLFGQAATMPVALAPIGLAGLYARRGEVQAARAAEAAGVPFTLSTMACCPIEEVRRGVERPFWLQLYMIRDRGFMTDLLDRTRAAGITTLILTVDLPVHSARHRDVRSSMTGPQGPMVRLARFFEIMQHPEWAWDVGVRGQPHILGNVASAMPDGAGLAEFTAWVGRNFDPSITWKDIDWIRTRWDGELIIKGVLDPDDARESLDVGAQGLIVSNHGGRQLDGARSSISALPGVVEAVAGRVPVMMDGGVRSGLDVLKAVALGAQGVLLGRAWAFALAAKGGPGVSDMLNMLRHEMVIAMALSGQTNIHDLQGSFLD